MQREYVYLVDSRAALLSLREPSPPQELIIASDSLRVPLDELLGKRLWLLVSRRKQFRLAAVGWVSNATICPLEGYAHAVSIALDPARSVAISTEEALDAIPMSTLDVPTPLLDVAKPALVRYLLTVALERSKVAAQPAISQVEPQHWTRSDGIEPVRTRLRRLLQSAAIDTIPLPAKLRQCGLSAPCACILWATRTPNEQERALLLELLLELDPLAPSMRETKQVEGLAIDVDTKLRPIEDGVVLARTYESIQEGHDVVKRLEALELAEQVHQTAVAGLASALRTVSIAPMMSRSVDLAFESAVALELIEVKSVHASNLQSQVASGLVQVLMYEIAFRSSQSRCVRSWLVLAAHEPMNIPPEFFELAKRVAVGLRLVHIGEPWQSELLATARWLCERTMRDKV